MLAKNGYIFKKNYFNDSFVQLKFLNSYIFNKKNNYYKINTNSNYKLVNSSIFCNAFYANLQKVY